MTRPTRLRAPLAFLLTGAVLALLSLGASSALAASLTNAGGTLTYAGADGHSCFLLNQPAPGTVDIGDCASGPGADPITADNCDPGPGGGYDYRCTGVTAMVATGGGGDDFLDASDLTSVTLTARGDAGGDYLAAGDLGDVLDGGAGDDTLEGGLGADSYAGGSGFDSASYFDMGATTAVINVTLDDLPGDGRPGEGDNVRRDVEKVSSSAGADVLSGGDAPGFTWFESYEGDDTVDPGLFEDLVMAGTGNDTVNARDGYADRIECGPDNDTVNADTLDVVADDCEIVNRQDVGSAREDRAPTVAITGPAAGKTIRANRPTTVTATASDDRGIKHVVFLDDDRVVCTDTAAPYECRYQPRGEDVNRNTLVAAAVDTGDQTAFATRTVLVPRFTARRLTIRTEPKRDAAFPFRFTTSGRLALPAPLRRALGCKGTVTVQIKAGKKTISTRRAKLSKTCRYRSRVTFALPGRLRPDTLRVTARFSGNKVVKRRSSKRLAVDVT
jgi:hypothetical protein